MLPLVQSGVEDRLSDLFGACGAHSSLGLVEVQAGLLEVQSAEIENACYLDIERYYRVKSP